MSTYNYESFPLDMEEADFHAFPTALTVGERAPNGKVDYKGLRQIAVERLRSR